MKLDREAVYRRGAQRERELGITVAEVSEIMGVSLPTVRRYQDSTNNRSVARVDQITAWCIHTDTSPSWLLLGVGSKTISGIEPLNTDSEKWRMHTASREAIAEDIAFLENSISRMRAALEGYEKKEPEGS